jgi:hypothetical protein
MHEKGKCITNLDQKSEKRVLKNPEIDGRIVLKCMLKWYEGVKWFHIAQDRNY